MAEKREFVFANGTGITVAATQQTDGTVLVTVTNVAPAGAAFGADVLNPGVAGGAGQVLPGAPHGWREIAPGSGEWVPYWTTGT